MKVLIDTNVLLDIALNRAPFVEHAAMLWRLAEQKEITACIANTSITDIFYICKKISATGPMYSTPTSAEFFTYEH